MAPTDQAAAWAHAAAALPPFVDPRHFAASPSPHPVHTPAPASTPAFPAFTPVALPPQQQRAGGAGSTPAARTAAAAAAAAAEGSEEEEELVALQAAQAARLVELRHAYTCPWTGDIEHG